MAGPCHTCSRPRSPMYRIARTNGRTTLAFLCPPHVPAGAIRCARIMVCPFCGGEAVAGQPCPCCKVGLPQDARSARDYVREGGFRYDVGWRGWGSHEWSGSIDNAARRQEES